MKGAEIDWWRTPAQSPDLNVIENLWHSLKVFIAEMNPQSKEDLQNVAEMFWSNLTPADCRRYIG